MVMFKARFRPLVGKPAATAATRLQAQQQQQPQRKPVVPPIEEERGPQAPIREPEPKGPPERALADCEAS